jgi:threonine dehydratase
VTRVGLEAIRLAQRRIAGVAIRTPLLAAPWAQPDAPLALKPESLQPVGSFKIRGAQNAIAAVPDAVRARGVVAHSSGNHGQAVAYCARAFRVDALVVMPDTSAAVKVRATRALGAEVVLVPPADRARRALEIARERECVLVPPYDDRSVIAGQGTVGLELIEEQPETDVVIVPVGGGGLISGVSAAVKRLRPGARVVGVEPALAADARESLHAGERRAWPIDKVQRTIADALRVTPVGELPWDHIRADVDEIVAVTDDELCEAVRVLARSSRLVAEPSGAASVAAYLFHRRELPAGRRHVAVVSGGNVGPAMFAEILSERAFEASGYGSPAEKLTE